MAWLATIGDKRFETMVFKSILSLSFVFASDVKMYIKKQKHKNISDNSNDI